MRKNGFTLAELIVTLSVVGIIGALVVPAISGVLPDKNKIRTLSYFSAINNTVTELMSMEGVYFNEDLENEITPTVPPFNDPNTYSGSQKFRNLLSYKLGIENGIHDDGSEWNIVYEVAGQKGKYKITIDIDGDDSGDNCYFGQDNCDKPDTHIFLIDKYGSLRPGDALTEAYLKNPLETNARKEDLEKAEEYKSKY